jgi:hypothetical protein
MYRNELKYVIDRRTAEMMSKRIEKLCPFDPHADQNGFYQVTSLYFDDFSDSALNDNLIGQIARKKYRIRVYNRSETIIRLEKKIKHNKGGKKESVFLTKEEYELILKGEVDFLRDSKSKLLREFAIDMGSRKLKPKVIVDYERQTFIYPYGTVRITFDHKIRFERNHLDLFNDQAVYFPLADEDQVVMEVKFTGFLPAPVRSVIQLGNLRQQSVSKYSLCRMGQGIS